MIPFDEIDSRLETLGKDRAWLAEASGRSPGSIRTALAPNAARKNRSKHLQKALTDALLKAEAEGARPEVPGYSRIFLDDQQLDRADRASRMIQAHSLADFCREAITFRADELLAGRQDPVEDPASRLKVAEDPADYPTPAQEAAADRIADEVADETRTDGATDSPGTA